MIERRASWLVSLADADADALFCAALRDAGGDPVRLQEDGPVVEGGTDLTGAIVAVTPPDVSVRLEVVRELRGACPDLTIIVVHGREDVAAAWAAMQMAATPWRWPTPSASAAWSRTSADELIAQLRAAEEIPSPMSTASVRQCVDDALISSVTSRPMTAIGRLCRVQRAGSTEEALDVLADTSAALLARLAHRSRHPIPLERIVDRLDVESHADRRRCTALLRSTMHRAEALSAAPEHTTTEASLPEQLYVAFHATSALVRFSAARSWMRPDRLRLDQVRGDDATRKLHVPA